jgi:hypothetical protein
LAAASINKPIPTLTLPLKGRAINFSPFKGEIERGMGQRVLCEHPDEGNKFVRTNPSL